MPFTLSHPAALAVLPRALRDRLPLAALAIGTMSPDFEYLFRLRPLSVWSHTGPGLVFFCLPAGLLAWIAWERIARGPTREMLALRTDRHPHPFAWKTVLLAALGILIGAVTHILWDSFTHAGRLGAILFPQLEREAWKVGTYSLRWFSVLQHLSTVLGAMVIGIWYLQERRRFGTEWRWTGAGLVALRIAAIGLLAGAVNAYAPHTLGDARYPGTMGLLARFAVGGMVGVGAALLANGVVRRASDRM